MNTRFLVLTSGLVSLLSLTAQAQTAAALPSAPQPPAPHSFRSALDGYQPYTDDKTLDWKAANDTTAQIGGWRAYAKEAAAPASAPKPAEAAPTAPAKP